ncbi:probable LRR receptor-like serine/threonine-protein kinase At2g16250 [Andrographis paniculata]|uniref:probable LRR receptor-like serine/threonine-protein kinase At2g16250 n=1 Tax=Andrographis paniculata TaxID=175694 RepID=UPI0021E92A3B|nr:probable LRR receptor-like serine/threonine-protein kinase At2g16250 [Andrographis paniculata]
MADQWRRAASIIVLFFFFFFDFAVQQQQQIFQTSWQERLSLIQLRSSLGIRARDWPVKSDPCASWRGIQCFNGSVTAINVAGFRRTRQGNLNPQFSVDALRNLTRLSSFNASNFALPGRIPAWLGLQLNALKVFDVRSSWISGDIPITLGNLSSLTELYLSDNNLTGVIPASLSQLLRISVLDLSGNSLTGSIPSGFGRLSMLQTLNLSGNALSSSIPPQLGNLSRLVDLDLGFNSLSGALPIEFRNLTSLQRMILGDNLIAGELPDDLFPRLTRLQSLVLRRNRFSGDLPHVVWSIPTLELLDVSGNMFTGMLPNVGSNAVAATALANISWNLFYGNVTPAIARFGFVDISGNYFEGSVPIFARGGGNASLVKNCLRNTPSQRGVAECASFYADRNLVFDNFGNPNPAQPPPPGSKKKSNSSTIIYASVFGGVGLLLLVFVLILIVVVAWKRRSGASNQRGISVGPVPPGGSPSPPGLPSNLSTVGDAFTYQQILQMTGEFNNENLIKRGRTGDFFDGVLEGGLMVVVKRIELNSSSVKKESSYMSELDLFSKITHPRLVPFLGHCLLNENEKFLVYKRMPNGDLSSALFKKMTSGDGLKSLDWITRLKIAIGAAEGLSYLHHECSPPLVHRDVQASSILLDDRYEVRLGSLGGVCAQEGDSHQNRITRLLRLPQSSEQGISGNANASCAYDVYCFGKVLLELVTGKLGISSNSSSSADPAVKEWLDKTLPYISIYDKELVTNIIDPSLIIDEDLLEEVWAMSIVARSCLNPRPARRPLMRYILKALENPLKVVREEHGGSSTRLRTASSRSSWNAAAVFGSWRHSSSDVAAAPAVLSRRGVEPAGSFKQSVTTTGSQGSGHIGDGNGVSPSSRRNSKEIFPEPVEEDRENDRG